MLLNKVTPHKQGNAQHGALAVQKWLNCGTIDIIFIKINFNKLAYSYQLSLAIISVCLVSEIHKSSTLTEKMLFARRENCQIARFLKFRHQANINV